MVKITLSFVALAVMVASVAAYPFQERPMSRLHKLDMEGFNECIPGVSVKEYHPFYIRSAPYNARLAKRVDSDVLTFGYSNEEEYEQLELCVVSTDIGCVPGMPSNCIYDNVEYRFRVNYPVQGYLKVISNDEIVIVDSFDEASGLNFYRNNAGDGLRIAHLEGGETYVFRANSNRKITLVLPAKNSAAQWFTIQESSRLRHPTCRD